MNSSLARLILVVLGVLVGLGMVVNEWQRSLKVWDGARFNLVYVDQDGKRVSVVSFDPVEQKTMILEYPEQLSISSRSVGEYKIGNLYTLGQYKQQGGEFARRKVQGFMRMPIMGYLVESSQHGSVRSSLSRALIRGIWHSEESNLSRIDSLVLWRQLGRYNLSLIEEDELVRAGIIVRRENETGSYGYMPERLSQYVGKQFFDWGVGIEGASVAVINESGIDGMGSDMAGFLTSMGLDVVVVRSGAQTRDRSRVVVKEDAKFDRSLNLIGRAFGFGEPEIGKTEEYRADIVLWVGKDAADLF